MDRDALEQFILDNRQAFETKVAPEGIWNDIASNLDRDHRIYRIPKSLFWALIMVILISAIGFIVVTSSNNQVDTSHPPTLEFADFQELKETKDYYTDQVNVKLDELSTYTSDATIFEDLRLLDRMEKDLLLELNNAEGEFKEYVLHAIIDNYQTRLSLLQNVLDEHKIANSQIQQHEKI